MMGSMLRQHNENPMGAMAADLMKQAGEGSYQGTRYRLSTIDDILGRLQLPQVIGAINGISFVILVILFLIIVVGVINTFRIILNERTREIGTMRALGMQRSGVRALLLLEALFLFLGGAVAGLIGAGVLMTLVSLASFAPNTPAFLMLRSGHPSFIVLAGADRPAAGGGGDHHDAGRVAARAPRGTPPTRRCADRSPLGEPHEINSYKHI